MNNILDVIRAIGRDIKDLRTNSLKADKAYELFPTYATLQSQMTTNIKEKHVELGLDTLIDTKLANGGDPFVTRSQVGNGGTQTVRRAPMMYTLDRRTNPWTIWFDNGCGLQLPDTPFDNAAYGYGVSPNINNTTWVNSPIVGNIISASRGTLTLDSVTNSVNGYFWGPNIKVINPVNDASTMDFSDYYINQTETNKQNHKNIVRVMYELGVWNAHDISQFSAHLDTL